MIIDALNGLPGVIAAALVGPDGLPIESQGEGGDPLAAELASLRATFDRIGRRLGAGDVTRLTLTSERVEVVAVSSANHVIGVALTRGQDTRSAQQTLARLALELTGLPRTEG
ncbi:roadblock/LC7 domain-containing protein [Deinococcus sp. KSM4-11]|uniref:roadblock/LC7 domain-containing protein n=1 Tax=Deinococcus sp. KSM4-11 TaxID=2568654 RepID=UPI0010A3FDFF|nr:roadblock/LC7 domain-containing protein [Deinococcus sp. KSM4-11]THF88530.1 roadblock/LC7 domain-containing protein [Deinococcus sp. KSM4-11]